MKMRVKDLMSKDIKSVPPEMNAKEALRILIANDMSGLPVIDSSNTLVGVFTEREILKVMLPVYVQDVGTFIYGEDSKAGVKKMAALEKYLVKDLMRKEVPVVDEESSLTEISKIMLTKGERRIIVMKDNLPAGVITRCDVIRGFAKEAGIY